MLMCSCDFLSDIKSQMETQKITTTVRVDVTHRWQICAVVVSVCEKLKTHF